MSQYVSTMQPQPLLLDRPFGLQLLLAVVIPAVYGLLTGLLLGISAAGYAVLSILGIAGGLVAGYDHEGSDQGFVRGICGGLLFGTFILVGHSVFGMEAKAKIPSTHGVLVGITTVFGGILGAIGGALRARHERRAGGETATA
jgi:hypothetical protein